MFSKISAKPTGLGLFDGIVRSWHSAAPTAVDAKAPVATNTGWPYGRPRGIVTRPEDRRHVRQAQTAEA